MTKKLVAAEAKVRIRVSPFIRITRTSLTAARQLISLAMADIKANQISDAKGRIETAFMLLKSAQGAIEKE